MGAGVQTRRMPSEMSLVPIATESAPAAIGPYSQAVVANGFVFCSGTPGIDPATGQVAAGIAAQTEQALTNLAAVLAAAGASMSSLVKTTVFYTDVDEFSVINEVYAETFAQPYPARSAPGGARFPRGIRLSIEAIALLP